MDTGNSDSDVNFKNTILKCLTNFEKKHNENQKLRIKYSDEPRKIAESETELFAALDAIENHVVDTELYELLLERKPLLSNLLCLLEHENTDIAIKVINIVQNILCQEGSSDLDMVVIELNLLDHITSNILRLDPDKKEEALCIAESFRIIEAVNEIDPYAIESSARLLIDWMIRYLKHEPNYTSTKFEISDLLLSLLSNAQENKPYLCEIGGIDVLLQQVAKYRKEMPSTAEMEFLAHIFSCLCHTVFNCDKAKESFLEEEGVDLVELLLREKNVSVRLSGIKMLTLQLFSYLVSTVKNEDPVVTKCCERFVEVLGLRVIFPIFANPKLVLHRRLTKHEYRTSMAEVEEHTSNILLAMLKFTQNEEYIQRILIKFADSNFDKFQRALSLHEKYFNLVQNIDRSDKDSTKSFAYCILKSIDYIILLVVYLGQHFETYDPIGGETFENYIKNTLQKKPNLQNEILTEARKYIEQIDSNEERGSLSLLMENFEQLSEKANNKT